MTQEREQTRSPASGYDVDDLDRDDRLAPGRISGTALMTSPTTPLISGLIARKARDDQGASGDAEQTVSAASSSSGMALPEPQREKFEAALGADLTAVRVHVGGASAEAADAVAARAYTIGSDIHFAAGEYNPVSAEGELLLAHEVAHTVQQQGGAVAKRQHKLQLSEAGDSFEHEADRAAQAMVSGGSFSISSVSTVISRKGDDKTLTAADKAKLENGKAMLAKAAANITTVTSAIQSYAASLPAFAAMKQMFENAKKVYSRAQNNVDRCIDKAVQVEATKDAVLATLLNAALGPVTDKLTKIYSDTNLAYYKLEAEDQATIRSMKAANSLVALQNFDAEVSKDTAGGSDKAKDKAVDAGKEAAGQGPTPDAPKAGGGPDKAEFYVQLEALRTKAETLPVLALAIGKLGAPLGAAGKEIEIMLRENKTVGKDAATVDTECAHVWNGSQGLVGAAPGVQALGKEIHAMSLEMQAALPKNDQEIEKELWMKWAAGLDQSKLSLMNLTGVANRCKALGIWDQMGIDPTGFLSFDDDKALAVCSANAQAKVMAFKGTSVSVNLIDGHALEEITLGGLPPLMAHVEGATKVRGQDSPQVNATAVVIGATAAKPMDKAALDKAGRGNKERITEYLLRHGYIVVTLRVYDADAAIPKVPPPPAHE